MSNHVEWDIEPFGIGDDTPLMERICRSDGSYRDIRFAGTTLERIFEGYASATGLSRSEFDSHYRSDLALASLKMPVLAAVASIDSGTLHDHPLLSGLVLEDGDYTGEGPLDEYGHGTLTAILSIVSAPFHVNVVNVKVIGRSGRGKHEHLVNALGSLPELAGLVKERHGFSELHAHVRCGYYSRRTFNLRECDGKCDICEAAIFAAENGVKITASVGNVAGRVACPAMAKIKRNVPGIDVLTECGMIEFG